MVLNSEKKDKFDESTGRCLILSSLVSINKTIAIIVLYVLGYFNRNKQNSYAAFNYYLGKKICLVLCQSPSRCVC